MADEGVLVEEAEVEEGEGEDVCLELIDLLLQGFPLLLGWGMAVEEEDEDGGGTRAEVAAGMLVEEPTVTADGDGACSVITGDCEVVPSEESLFRCELALVLSLKPWLRRFPAALSEPRGGMSLPAVDTLAEGPGSLDCISACAAFWAARPGVPCGEWPSCAGALLCWLRGGCVLWDWAAGRRGGWELWRWACCCCCL